MSTTTKHSEIPERLHESALSNTTVAPSQNANLACLACLMTEPSPTPVVGFCQSCGAAVCLSHVFVLPGSTRTYLLPRRAEALRRLVCAGCAPQSEG